MKVVILTAGIGKKLEPLTDTRPKPMIEICGEPVLARLCRFIQEIGISHAEVIIGHHHEKITTYFESHPMQNFSVRYIPQEYPASVGNAILCAKHRIEPSDYFMLLYGDILFSRNMLRSLMNSFKSLQKPVASVCLTNDSRAFGNIYMDHQMNITEIIEKPQRSDLGNYILAGAFILPGTIFKYLEDAQENIIDALRRLSHSDGFCASIWEGSWVDLGYPWDILTANQIVMNEWLESKIATDFVQEPGCFIKGPVVIESGVSIKAGANIVGPCFIGSGSFIGHNALVRNYTSIGSDSIVGFGVEMKNSVVFRKTEIGRLSFIGDSVIGENANIGSGTVLVNINIDQSNVLISCNGSMIDSGLIKLGSFVGDDCWIGAGNTFLPGTKIRARHIINHHSTLTLNSTEDQ